MRRSVDFIGRWTWRIAGTFLILCALFILISQTEVFRRWLKDTILDIANDALVGKLSIDEARLDIFHGIVLIHPKLYADGTLAFEANELSVSYDVAAIANAIGAINEVRIDRPFVYITRSKEGVWNVDRIVKPDLDTTTSEPPNITIAVRAIRIVDGTVVVNDRTTPWSDGTRFDPLHIRLDEFNLNVSIRAQLKEKDYAVAVNGMSFVDKYGPLDVKDLALVARLTPTLADLQSFRLITERSDVSARAKINDADLTKGFSDSLLAQHPIIGFVHAQDISGADLKFFVPEVDLEGSYHVRADVKFDGNSLETTDLLLAFADTHVVGDARFSNLSGSKPISINIRVANSQARYSDVKRRLRFVPLPDLPFLSLSDLKSVHLRGEPENSLWMNVEVRDKPGYVKGEISLTLNKPKLEYQTDVQIKNGNLAVFNTSTDSTAATASTASTDLNGRVMMVGKGVKLKDLLGTYQVELDRSKFYDRPLRSFRTLIKANGQGAISIDTLFADLTPFKDDTTEHDPFDELSSQRISLSGALDVSDTSHPKYRGSINANGLDLATLLRDTAMPNRLSWKFDIDAQGFELDSIQGQMNGRVLELMLADRSMMPFNIDCSSTKTGSTRSISLTTNFANVKINGAFQPSTLIEAIGASAETVAKIVVERAKLITKNETVHEVAPRILTNMDALVDIDILDVSPINMVIPDVALSGSAKCRSRFVVTPSTIEIVADTIEARDVSVVANDVDVYCYPVQAMLDVKIANVNTSPRVERLSLKGGCDSLIRVGETRLNRPKIEIEDKGGNIDLIASSMINEMRAGINANIKVNGNEAEISIDTASFTLDEGKRLKWELSKPANVVVKEGVFEFKEFTMNRMWTESVSITGTASTTTFDNLNVKISNFPLRDIPLFAPLSEGHPLRLVGGKIDDLDVTLNGEWSNPVASMKMKASDVAYNGALIGDLKAELDYESRDVKGSVEIKDRKLIEDDKTLVMNINALPLDLSLTKVEERFVSGKPVDISLDAKDLALAVAEPFIPAIEHLRGKCDAYMSFKGTSPDKIVLGGNGRFKNARFLSASTNIEYDANGVMRLEGEKLFLDTVNVYNLDKDLRGGFAFARGEIDFDGFSVKNFEFIIETPKNNGIKILNRASQVRSPNVYGNLIISSGKRSIRMSGSPEKPRLSGELVVNYADLNFPKERSSTKAKVSSVKYIGRKGDSSRRENILDYYSTTTPVKKDTALSDSSKTNSTQPNGIKKAVIQATPSFADIIDYDLDIWLKGRVLIKMVMGTLEVLVADMEQDDKSIPLEFTGKFYNNSTNFKGKVRVKEGTSTYQFYKPFRTSGTLDFNQYGLTNPVLDLKAVYENKRIVNATTNQQETYKVQLDITGTKQSPRIAYRIWRNGREVYGDPDRIAGDALMLILVGKTQEELANSGQGSFDPGSLSSAALNNLLGEIVQGDGVIVQNVTIDVAQDPSNSMVTLSGQIYGDLSYRVTGQVSDFSGNSTFTVTLPLSTFGNAKALEIFQMDFSHTVNNTGNVTRQTRLWEIKLGARVP